MIQALYEDKASETTNPKSFLASLYSSLLYIALGRKGKKHFLEEDVHKQTEAARTTGHALQQLQRGLTGERRFAGEAYFSNPDFLSAYLLYYWPVSFMQTSLALLELKARGRLGRFESILDLGAGPGPASAAAVMYGAERVLLLDRSEEALQQALALLSIPTTKSAAAAATTALASTTIPVLPGASSKAPPAVSSHVTDLETVDTLPEGPFDLIIACHSANELWKQDPQALDKRIRLFGQAVERLSEGGILLVIEPSALATSRPALALRDRLLQVFSDSLHCLAPCPGSHPCPILAAGEGRSCHSTWAWDPYEPIAALATAAGLDRDSVKATWFALQRTIATHPTQDMGKTPAESEDNLRYHQLTGRVISEPMLNKAGRLRYIICTATGLATISAKTGDSAAETAGFFSLHRGDMIEAAHLERREGERNFGFVAESTLSMSMKAPQA